MTSPPLRTHASARAAWRRRRSHLCRTVLAPPPKLTLSEWADRYRVLSRENSAQPGRFRTDVVPYLREVMDACTDRRIREVVVMKAAQVAFTDGVVNNLIGYHIHQDPAPILVVQVTEDEAEKWSKEKLSLMLRDTPVLRDRVKDPRSRDSGNTILSKALALDTAIATPSGWTTMGGIVVGDTLFDEHGKPTRVTDTTEAFHGHTCYRVTFSDGATIIADEGHLWTVERWRLRQQKQTLCRSVITTAELRRETEGRERATFSIPLTEPLELPAATLPVDPYILGAWLGDGMSHRARIVAGFQDGEMGDILRAAGAAVRRSVAGRCFAFDLDPEFGKEETCPLGHLRDGNTSPDGHCYECKRQRQTRRRTGAAMDSNAPNSIRAALKSMGLLKRSGVGPSRKAIPAPYLRGSVEQRLALLQGLMDTDGSITPNYGYCSFSTTLPVLADGMCELLASLGFKSTRRAIATQYPLRGELLRSSTELIQFCPGPRLPVFRLTRKLAIQMAGNPVSLRTSRRRVVSVEPVASVPVRCITVESANHLYLAGRAMVPTHNSYPGGHLGIVGANAPAGLRARPRRVVIFDEIDGYPPSAGTEGNPIKLGEKRTTTFWNRKIVKGSTPTLKDFSNIEREFDRSDQRRWFAVCPHCGAEQVLVWKNVRWDKVGEGGTKRHKTETAHLVCETSGCVITESERQRMVRAGRWIPTAPPALGETKPVGFHIPGLISPFITLAELAAEFVEAKAEKDLLQTFINTRLGETFEEAGEKIEAGTLYSRRESYATEVPAGVGVLTASVDVQGDRLEVEVKGWGDREESWLVHVERLLGDPGDADGPDNVWARLEEIRQSEWHHEAGALVRIGPMVIDYGGHYADMVARYVKKTPGVFAIRGAKDKGKPIWPAKPARVGKHKVKLYELGTDTAKDIILGSRIRIISPGPGYMHFPITSWCNEEYFAQLASEKKVPRMENGRWGRRWVPTRDRNEALDLEVYALAALRSLGDTTIKNLGRKAEQLRAEGAALAAKPTEANAPPTPKKPARGRSGWVNSWRS